MNKKEIKDYESRNIRNSSIKIINIKFICPVTNKEEYSENNYFTSNDSACDCCGSHGYIKVDVTCSCDEKEHTINLSDW